ncbi:MAG: hypothetical protein JSS65_13915 [Armatimonadetes bacterium]|nr:hypothetical protein [Armatimonadota bacterium]
MKKFLALAAIGLAAVSNAQWSTPTNLGVRIGWVYPIDSGLRDVAPTYLGAGVDYYPDFQLLKGNGETYLSFDWIGKSGSGAKGNLFPILLNHKFYGTQTDKNQPRSYFSLGAGVAIVDVTSTNTVLAAKVGVGRELNENLFLEGNLFYTDSSAGVHGTSLGFYLGYRF